MIVTDLTGQTEMLTDYSNVAIRQKVNEDYTLSFTVVPTDKNTHSYPLVQEESLIECENELYVIKQCIDNPYNKSVTALHEFFETVNDYVEEVLLEGLYPIEEALAHAFSSTTDWTYVVEDTFQQATLTDFGNNNLVALLQSILESYNAEYTVSSTDKVVRIKKQLGTETDYQVRYKHNLITINRQTDSSNVKTAVKVYFNPDEFGEYRSSVIYFSPNKDLYNRTKWAEPLYLDTVTTESEALAYAATQLQDTPIVSITTEFIHLQEAGYDGDDMSLGNSFFLIDERINLSNIARIVEIERYPFDKSKSPRITVANKRKSITDVTISQKQQHNQLNDVAVKQKKIYNGCTITKEDGFKATAQNGVVVMLNASEGILVINNEVRKFFVDVDGNLIMDGKLQITSEGNTLLEAFLDKNGGVLNIYDEDGNLNTRIGSNKYSSTTMGGAVFVYADGDKNDHIRGELSIDRISESGQLELRDSNGQLRVKISVDSGIRIMDSNGNIVTDLSETSGEIGGDLIATRDWVRDYVDDAVSSSSSSDSV